MRNLLFRGANQSLVFIASIFLATTGCTPKVRIDLLNDTGQTLEAVVLSGGRSKIITIPTAGHAILDTPNPLVLHVGRIQRVYHIPKLPPSSVKTTLKGTVLHIALCSDERLYVRDPSGSWPAAKLLPQSPPFPISPSQ
jgi:hypothetical protein